MVAKFLNNVRVLFKEGCEERFIAATEAWVNSEGMLHAFGLRQVIVVIALLVSGKARKILSPQDLS